MARSEIVTTQNEAPASKSAKQAYDQLVEQVARDGGLSSFDANQVSNVELHNGSVTVEYVDKSAATALDPTPVRHFTADVK